MWCNCPFPLSTEDQFCGGRLTKTHGSVKTPNWPNSNYPAGISCSWHISVPPSNVSRRSQLSILDRYLRPQPASSVFKLARNKIMTTSRYPPARLAYTC